MQERCLCAPVCTRVGVCGTQQCPGECRAPVCPWLAPCPAHHTNTQPASSCGTAGADLVAGTQGLAAALRGAGNCSGRHGHRGCLSKWISYIDALASSWGELQRAPAFRCTWCVEAAASALAARAGVPQLAAGMSTKVNMLALCYICMIILILIVFDSGMQHLLLNQT